MGRAADEVLGRVVRQVAAAYARRCWWAEKEDLEQRAWVAVLEVRRDFGEEDLHSLGGLAWVAAMRQLGRYLRRIQSPASASDHDVKNMEGFVRAPADRLVSTGSAEEDLELHRIRHAIRLRIFKLVGRTPYTEAAAMCFLDGARPREVAADWDLDVFQIYRWNRWVKMAVLDDDEVVSLAIELADRRGI